MSLKTTKISKHLISLAFFLIFFVTSIFAYENNISKNIFSRFSAQGFQPEKQLLAGTLSEDFPYNIIIDIPANKKVSETKSEQKPTIILSLNQYDVITVFNQISSFISDNLKNPPNLHIIVILSVNDNSILPLPYAKQNAGIETFIENLPDGFSTFAFILDTDKFNPDSQDKAIPMVTGGSGTLTPFQLLKITTTQFNKNNIPYTIAIPYFSLFRLNSVVVNSRLEYLLKNNIPSIGFSIKNFDQFDNALLIINSFANDDIPSTSISAENWDRQYSIISFLNRTYVFSESFQVTLFLIISGAFLIFIIVFSLYKNNSFVNKSDYAKTWFLPVLLITMNLLCFFIAQKLCIVIFTNWKLNPQLAIIFKLMLSLSLFYTLSSIQYCFSFPHNNLIYSFFAVIFSIVNFFVFFGLDFSLLVIFAIVTLIIFITRGQTKTLSLIFIVIVTLFPFIPFAITLLKNCTDNSINNLISSPFVINLYLSFLIIPYQFLLIRLRIARNNFGHYYTTTKARILRSIFIPLTCFIICLLSIIIYSNKTTNTTSTINNIYVNDSAFSSIIVNSSKQKKLGYIEYTSKFIFREPVIRYDIEIVTDSTLPLFDSNYPCDIFSKLNTAIFNIDELPPNPFILNWKSESENNPVLNVVAWIKISDNSFKRELYKITFDKSE